MWFTPALPPAPPPPPAPVPAIYQTYVPGLPAKQVLPPPAPTHVLALPDAQQKFAHIAPVLHQIVFIDRQQNNTISSALSVIASQINYIFVNQTGYSYKIPKSVESQIVFMDQDPNGGEAIDDLVGLGHAADIYGEKVVVNTADKTITLINNEVK